MGSREQETYAIVQALLKWRSWIGMQPVLVLTDHKALEEWHHEVVETPSGPTGRRLRWHEVLESFNVQVLHIAGKENTVADALSRWAYPASKGYRDMSKHGSQQDVDDVRKIKEEEAADESTCVFNISVGYDECVNATELQQDTLVVAPVDAEAESSV